MAKSFNIYNKCLIRKTIFVFNIKLHTMFSRNNMLIFIIHLFSLIKLTLRCRKIYLTQFMIRSLLKVQLTFVVFFTVKLHQNIKVQIL